MKARGPACRWCKKPVVAGQVDGEGQPAHFQCQVAFAMVSPRAGAVARGQAAINPKLPQAEAVAAQAFPSANLYSHQGAAQGRAQPKGNP